MTTAKKNVKNRRRWRRLFSAMMCVVLLFGLASPARAENPVEKYNRLKGELAELEKEREAYKGQLAYTKQLRENLLEEQRILFEMIEIQKQEVERTEGELLVKEQEIADKRQVIFDNDQLLRERLVAIYKMNNSSMLSSLLHVDNFSQLLVLTEGLRRISKHDTDFLAMLDEQKTQLEAEEAELYVMLEGLQEHYDNLEADAARLAENLAALDSQISKAEADLLAKQQAYNEKQLEVEEANRARLAFINSISGGSNSGDGSQYVGGRMQWPVGVNGTITTRFGQGGHGGLDISTNGATGVSALAAADGTVIQAGWHDHKYSYGNYVVIDHGGGVRTLYAHLAAIYVSSGSVAKGTAIGEVGNTGYSFGIHLHFEVHQDGVRQNPESWLKG